jgi:hypothetical protein
MCILLRQFSEFSEGRYSQSIVTPVLGISGVGGAMAIYGASDVVVSEITTS